MKLNIDKLLHSMSIREKAGQLFLQEFQSYWKPTDEIIKVIHRGDIGGTIYFTGCNVRNAAQLAELTWKLQRAAKKSPHALPLIISIDHEGGQLNSLLGGTNHPGNMAIAATKNAAENAKIAGRITGRELKAAGITVNFAPVVDVVYDTKEAITDNRSYSSNPDVCSKLAVAYYTAHEAQGVATCAKHFPGQRIVPAGKDTHYELDVIPFGTKRLNAVEFKPFKSVCAAGIASIMAGHCAYAQYDNKKTPASLSKNLMTKLLREQWGYTGLMITDDLIMQAIMKMYSKEQAIVKSINAGADLIIITGETRNAAAMLEKAVQTGRVKKERLDEACRCVLEFKQTWCAPDFDYTRIESLIHRPADVAKVTKMAAEAITLVRDADKLLPLKPKKREKVLIIHPGFHRLVPSDQTNFYKPDMQAVAAKHFDNFVVSTIGQKPTFSEIDSTLDLTVWSDYVIFMTINASFNKEQVEMLKRVITFKHGKVITVALRSPTDIFAYPFAPTHLITYGHNEEQLHALFKIITGKAKATGRIPLHFDAARMALLKSRNIKRLPPPKETPRV